MEYLYNAYKLLVCINVICSIFFYIKTIMKELIFIYVHQYY